MTPNQIIPPLIHLANSLPNNKILAHSKLKELADNKINVTQELKVVSERTENFLGKGENAGYQHFLLFQNMFSKAFFLGVVRSQDCVVKYEPNWKRTNPSLEFNPGFIDQCLYDLLQLDNVITRRNSFLMLNPLPHKAFFLMKDKK